MRIDDRWNRFQIRSAAQSATSVIRILPSSAGNFNCPIFWDSSLPYSFSLVFRAFQYFLTLGLSVSAAMTSMIEKYHFS